MKKKRTILIASTTLFYLISIVLTVFIIQFLPNFAHPNDFIRLIISDISSIFISVFGTCRIWYLIKKKRF